MNTIMYVVYCSYKTKSNCTTFLKCKLHAAEYFATIIVLTNYELYWSCRNANTKQRQAAEEEEWEIKKRIRNWRPFKFSGR